MGHQVAKHPQSEAGRNPSLQDLLQPNHKLHLIDPGDWVYVKNFTGDPLRVKWDRSIQVLLTSFKSV